MSATSPRLQLTDGSFTWPPNPNSDDALGDAFNSCGIPNTEFKFGDIVSLKTPRGTHTAHVARHGRQKNCYDLLLFERQVCITTLTARDGGPIARDKYVNYTKNNDTEVAIVEKIDNTFTPAVAYIRILRREVHVAFLSPV